MLDPQKETMLLSDAVAMFKHKIDMNERPYQRISKEYTNSLVDEWHKRVGLQLSDKEGKIICGVATESFMILLEGRSIKSCEQSGQKDFIAVPQREHVEKIIQILTETSVDNLVKLGRIMVGRMFNNIISFLTDERDKLKYELVYSRSDDPLFWFKETNKHAHLLSPERNPLGLTNEKLKELNDKVVAVAQGYPTFEN